MYQFNNFYLYWGFPIEEEDRFPRTPVNIASISFEQCHEASR
jgi:hypothetical protein